MKSVEAIEYCVVLCTAGDLTEAHRIADALIEAREAACVQLEQISSVYRWDGAIETSGEVRLSIKTRTTLFARVAQRIREHHSYETPEILRVDIVEGDPAYLEWMSAATEATS